MDVPDPVVAAGTELKDYYWACGTYQWEMNYVPGHWEYYEFVTEDTAA